MTRVRVRPTIDRDASAFGYDGADQVCDRDVVVIEVCDESAVLLFASVAVHQGVCLDTGDDLREVAAEARGACRQR